MEPEDSQLSADFCRLGIVTSDSSRSLALGTQFGPDDSFQMIRMAEGEGSQEPERDDNASTTNGRPLSETPKATAPDDTEEEEEEEEEPRLKYAPLTRNLTSLYRNGDASSAFLVAGDKMVGSLRDAVWRVGRHTYSRSSADCWYT